MIMKVSLTCVGGGRGLGRHLVDNIRRLASGSMRAQQRCEGGERRTQVSGGRRVSLVVEARWTS